MIVKTFVEPPIDNNNYVIVDENTSEAALVDCSSLSIWDKVPYAFGNVSVSTTGENRQEIKGVKLKYILLTHGHFDHIAGIKPKNMPISLENDRSDSIPEVLMHKADMEWVNRVNEYMPMMGMPEISVPKIDRFIEEGDIISIDIPNNSLNVKVSDEELAKRKEKWQPREPKVNTGYLARYRELVTSGNRGAVLEIPR